MAFVGGFLPGMNWSKSCVLVLVLVGADDSLVLRPGPTRVNTGVPFSGVCHLNASAQHVQFQIVGCNNVSCVGSHGGTCIVNNVAIGQSGYEYGSQAAGSS